MTYEVFHRQRLLLITENLEQARHVANHYQARGFDTCVFQIHNGKARPI